jgi:hypothetical protein
MITQIKDKKDYFGTMVFIVLFFLLICGVSKNSDQPIGSAFQHELVSELHSNNTAINDVQQFIIQKSLFSLNDKTIFKLFSENFKMITENRLINKRILFLQKAQPIIKPVVPHRLYYHNHNTNTEDFPVLG